MPCARGSRFWRRWPSSAPPPTCRWRLGVASGLVLVGDVIGEGAAEEAVAFGEPPNHAARRHGLAPPDGLLVADAIKRLLAGLFELPPDASYCFKRALVRDTAYESLLKSRRRAIHVRLLDALQHGIERAGLAIRMPASGAHTATARWR